MVLIKCRIIVLLNVKPDFFYFLTGTIYWIHSFIQEAAIFDAFLASGKKSRGHMTIGIRGLAKFGLVLYLTCSAALIICNY